MIWVEPGTFTMGSPETETGRSTNETEHNVTLTKGFYLGKYEVTQAQYEAVMTGNTETDSNGNVISATPSQFGGNPNRPVEMVSWDDIQVFLTRLNEQQADNLPAGWAYVLPTEAQWEYACRAGTTTAYSWGDEFNSTLVNSDNNVGSTSNVGNYPSNAWGFYDMHGNVHEWASDWYESFSNNSAVDPLGPLDGSKKTLRGGSFPDHNSTVRSARRGKNKSPSWRDHNVGFRLALRDINKAPIDFNSTYELTIFENQPIGTIVADFNATDPEGGVVTYSLESGEGFIIDENGTLKTSTNFNYENNTTSYELILRATDELNASSESVVIINISDEYEDTDGDGFRDSLEYVLGTGINDANSMPFADGLVLHLALDGTDENFEHTGVSQGLDRYHNPSGATFFPGGGRLVNDSFDNFPSDALTLTYWERVTGATANCRVSFSTSSHENTFVNWGSSNVGVHFNEVSESGSFSHDPFYPPYTWIQRTTTWRSSDGAISFYIDGEAFNTSTYVPGYVFPTSGSLSIGQDQDGQLPNQSFNDGFVGYLDELRLYNRVLTPLEIEKLFEYEKPPLGQDMQALAIGPNPNGELGMNVDVVRKTPKHVANQVVSVASGIYHSLIIKEGGSLWAVGRNHYGQLGDGTKTDRSVYNMVVPSGVRSIAASGYHSLFVKDDGSLWGFGNYRGLGEQVAQHPLYPTRLVPSGVKEVVSGVYHSLFIKTDGSLWGMGDNTYGQLGTENLSSNLKLFKISDEPVVSMAGGYKHSAFVKEDGSLWTMGSNTYGQLGDGTNTDKTTPVLVVSSGVVEVSAGVYHTYFRKTDGSLWTFGYNDYGQLGDGTLEDRWSPVQIETGGVVALADCSYEHGTKYLKENGSVWAFGLNSRAQIGDGEFIERLEPVEIHPSNAKMVSSGHRFGQFLLNNGELWAFGNRTYGVLGDRIPMVDEWSMVEIPGGVVDYDVGYFLSSFIDVSGKVWGTGFNEHDYSGNETRDALGKWVINAEANATKVASSHFHSLYIDRNGSLWGVGRNTHGQLGIGDYEDRNQSIRIVESGVADVSVGAHFSMFTKTNGSLWTMGQGYWGSLGDDSRNNQNLPVQIEENEVAAIATGYWSSYYLKTDGSLWAMGYNVHGQLGIGEINGTLESTGAFEQARDKAVPTQVVDSGVVSLSAGPYHTLFIKEDGSLWGMGGETQLGGRASRSPIKLHDTGVVYANAGSSYSSMIKADGSFWVLGNHGLGDTPYTDQFMRVDVFPVLKSDGGSASGSHVVLVPQGLGPQKIEIFGGEVFENSKSGTTVGHVVASDFDEDSNFSYSFTSGVGDTHNQSFSIDENGWIRSTNNFDREADANLSVRVRVTDESNRTLEKSFLIEVLDDPAEDLILADQDDRLIGYWRFDEEAGMVARDSSGNGYHAHLRGAGEEAWVKSGIVNGAVSLDGVDDYLAIQGLHYSQPGEIQELTISCWIKTTQADKEGFIFSFDRSEFFRLSTGNRDINVFDTPYFSLISGGNQHGIFGTTGGLANGDWVHLVASHKASSREFKIYIDGQLDTVETKGSVDGVGSGMTRYGFIGAGSEAKFFDSEHHDNYQGLIDDLRLYHHTLSDAEINGLYLSATTDSDTDGLSDLEESHLGTFANLADSDGDGLTDGEEVKGYTSLEYIEGNFTWQEALLDAESRGGHLATITTEEENNRAHALLPETVNAWLGGLDADVDGNFTWITDELWEYDGRDANLSNRVELDFHFSDFGSGQNDLILSGDASFLQDPTLSPYSDHHRLRLVPAQNNQFGTAEYAQSLHLRDGFDMSLLWQTTVPNSNSSGADQFILRFGSQSGFYNVVFDTFQNVPQDASAATVKIHPITVDLNALSEFSYLGGDLSNQGKTAEPYLVRVKYLPGKLSIWLDGKVVVSDHPVNLEDLGYLQADGSGTISLKADCWGQFENHDILSWSFSALNSGQSPGLTIESGEYWKVQPTEREISYLMERVFYSNPLMPDTDGDGLLDGEEVKPITGKSNPQLVDSDADGRSDSQEIISVKSYELIEGNFTWDQARDDATLRGGYLATITSEEENEKVTTLLPAERDVWIGGVDEELNGEWNWWNGENWTFNNLAPGQPDNHDGNSTKLMFWHKYPGKWADHPGTAKLSYLLERDISTDPAMYNVESPFLPSDSKLKWTELAPAPTAQFLYDGTDVIDGRIYAAGGSYVGYNDQLIRYDPQIDEWETLAPLSMPRRFMSSAVIDGKFYAIGGSDGSTQLDSMEIYDPATNSWTQGPSLPRKSTSACSVEWNGKILLFGGGNGEGQTDEILEFDPSSGQWSTLATMPSTRSQHSAVVWGDKIYIVGGSENSVYSGSTSGLIYDPLTNEFFSLPDMNERRAWISLIVVGDRLYAVGGCQESQAIKLSSIEVFDPDGWQWMPAGDLPEAKFCAGAVTIDDSAYLIAGQSGDQMSDRMFLGTPNKIILEFDNQEPAFQPVAKSYQLARSAENNVSATLIGENDTPEQQYALLPSVLTPLEWEAEDYSWGRVSRSTSESTEGYSAGIGLVGAGDVLFQVYDAAFVVYDVNVTHPGLWKLEIRRAALEARPCKIFINGLLMSTEGAGGISGGWYPEHQAWKVEGAFPLHMGRNEIRIERAGYFPHIDKIRLTPEFSVAGDQELFSIDSQTGELFFRDNPDFEIPHDANQDNIYEADILISQAEESWKQRVYLKISDNPEAVLTRIGNEQITLEAGDEFIDEGVEWVHESEGNGTLLGVGEMNNTSPGSYNLTYRLVDSLQQVYELNRTVTVVDNTPPMIQLIGDANITHEVGTIYIDENATWTDIVDGHGVILASGDVNISRLGSYKLNYDYTDTSGNEALTVSRVVSVFNHEPQNLEPISPLEMPENIGLNSVIGQFSAFDPNGHQMSFHLMNGEGNESNHLFDLELNGTLRTLSLFDYETNASSYSIRVQVIDEYNGTLETNFTVQLLDVFEDLDGDNIEDHLDNDMDGDGYPNEEEVAYGSDPRNPDSVANRAPVNLHTIEPLRIAENQTVGTYVGQFSANDSDGDSLTFHFASERSDHSAFVLDENGSLFSAVEFDFEQNKTLYKIDLLARDPKGAEVTALFEVTVLDLDDESPVIVLNGDANITHEAGFAYIDLNATWSDNVDGIGVVTAEGDVDISTPGEYVLSYNYTDEAGNVANEVTRTVRVVDTTLPIITLNGDANITHEAGFAYIDLNATWSDHVDGIGVVTAEGEVDISTSGDYVLSYNYTDKAGNAAVTVTRTVHVVDTTGPVIEVGVQSPLVHGYRTAFSIPVAEAYDLIDGNVSESIVVSGEVDPLVLGEHELIYRVSDSHGNEADPFVLKVFVDDGDFDRTPYNLVGEEWLGVEENQPVGTYVGEFNATDPDMGELTYSLVVGEGGDDNERFVMEENGTLRTNEVFDYEQLDNYTVRVRAEVVTGHGVEGIYVVRIWDQVAPVVETLTPEGRDGGLVYVGGRILDAGASSGWSTGMLVSFDLPFYNEDKEGVVKLAQGDNETEYGLEFFPGEDVKKVYTMAYAQNGEGISYGLLEEYENVNRGEYDNRGQGDFWTGAKPMDGYLGWWESWWFGSYYKSDNGWWYHLGLGWVYPSGAAGEGMWLWKEGLNWVWTKEYIYPFLYSHDRGSWYYLYGELDQKRMLYDYGLREWKHLDDRGVDESRGEEIGR